MDLWLRDISEKDTLSYETDFLKQVINSLDTAIFCVEVLDFDTFVFRGFNQAHENHSGLISKDLIGKRPEEITVLPPDIREAIKKNYQRCLQSEKGIQYQESIVVEGKITHWLTKLKPLRDEKKQITRIIGSSSPINEIIYQTEQLQESKKLLKKVVKQREKALKESEERYQLATEASNQGIWDWVVAKNVVFYSKTWKAQIGYQENELPNEFKTWQDHLHPDDYDRCNQAVLDYLNNPVGKFILDFRFRHKDGHYVWIHNEAAAKLDEEGKVIRMFGAHSDVTENMQKDLELKESEIRFRSLFQNIPDAVFIADIKTGKIKMVNRAGVIMMQMEKDEIIGMHQTQLHPPSDRNKYEQLFKDCTHSSSTKVELEIQQKDGSILPVFLHAAAFESNGDHLMMGLFRDISDRKKIEAEVQEYMEELSESNLSKDRLISILAHDLKTPFNSILGLLEILNLDYDQISNDDKKLYISKLYESAAKTYELLENVLNWSRIRQGKLKPALIQVNIRNLTENCLSVLKPKIKQKEIELINHMERHCLLNADKDMVEMILRNLVTNALKFTPRGGKISLNCKEYPRGHQITVRDTGIGIPKEAIRKIFDPGEGYTTSGTENEAGTGLGLILCKEFAEMHHGKLEIDSSPGKGTLITLSIPS